MINFELDEANSTLVLVLYHDGSGPATGLHESDFVKLAEVVDPHIEATGGLDGLLISAPNFPGWDSFGAMVPHIRFARDHQRYVKKIALVTDSCFEGVLEHLASHFVSAQIHRFPAGDIERAQRWIGEERRHRSGKVVVKPGKVVVRTAKLVV